jgi:anion-transporting  ArsA/GET3 family ATPase
MKRLLGFDLLEELSEFFTAFSGMVEGFQERARRVNELLGDPSTCFLVVCGPQGEPIAEAVYFHGRLMDADLPFGGVIVNKVNSLAGEPGGDASSEELCHGLAKALGDERLADRVTRNFADYRALAERDDRNIRALAEEMQTDCVIRVPYLDEDVHDLAGLAQVNRHLFAAAGT